VQHYRWQKKYNAETFHLFVAPAYFLVKFIVPVPSIFKLLGFSEELQNQLHTSVDREGMIKILPIKHRKRHWSFPKGHEEKEETESETALCWVKEETGLNLAQYEGFRNIH